MIFNFNFLYNYLLKNNFQFGNKNVSRDLQGYVLYKTKDHAIIDLKTTVTSLQKVLLLLLRLRMKNGKVLFIGHPTNNVINKIIRITAMSTNQKFYNFKLQDFNYAELSINLKKMNPDLIVVFSTTISEPILRMSYNLNLPNVGITDLNSKSKFLTYFIVGSESSHNLVYALCKLFITILTK